MFYTWGMSGCPHVHMPPVCSYAPPEVYMPPYAPILFMPLCVFEALHVVWGCYGLPFVLGHPPYIGGCLPLTPPTFSHWFPVHWYVLGISVCYMGIFLLSVRVWGCFPYLLGVEGGISTCNVHMLILVLFCSALCLTF